MNRKIIYCLLALIIVCLVLGVVYAVDVQCIITITPWLPYQSGDHCTGLAMITTAEPVNVRISIWVEIDGRRYYWPSWTQTLTTYHTDIVSLWRENIFEFTWPAAPAIWGWLVIDVSDELGPICHSEHFWEYAGWKYAPVPTSVPCHVELSCLSDIGCETTACGPGYECPDTHDPLPGCCVAACCEDWDQDCNRRYWLPRWERCQIDWLPECDDVAVAWERWK